MVGVLRYGKLFFEDESCLYSHSAWVLSCGTDTATPHIVFLLAWTRINPGSIKMRALRRLPSSELLGLLGVVVNCCKSYLSQLSSTSPAACSNHLEWYNKPVCDAEDDCPERHKEILSVSLFTHNLFFSLFTQARSHGIGLVSHELLYLMYIS